MSDKVSVGDEAPEFALPASGSEDISLAYFKGKTLVLYFYPKDDTAGCTKEAIAFTEHVGAFEAAGVSVIGASKDSVSNHDKFIAKHDLGVQLISDEDGTLCEDYGVWVQKSMYGRKYMGIERSNRDRYPPVQPETFRPLICQRSGLNIGCEGFCIKPASSAIEKRIGF